MYKFQNPDGVVATFDGNALGEIMRHDPAKKYLPAKLNLRGVSDRSLIESFDAFNVLDIFIVSEAMLSAINDFTHKDWPTRVVKVFDRGVQFSKPFAALVINEFEEVGSLKATEADWMPDAAYPVRSGVYLPHHLALDLELKFPVISVDLHDHLAAQGFQFKSFQYPDL